MVPLILERWMKEHGIVRAAVDTDHDPSDLFIKRGREVIVPGGEATMRGSLSIESAPDHFVPVYSYRITLRRERGLWTAAAVDVTLIRY